MEGAPIWEAKVIVTKLNNNAKVNNLVILLTLGKVHKVQLNIHLLQ